MLSVYISWKSTDRTRNFIVPTELPQTPPGLSPAELTGTEILLNLCFLMCEVTGALPNSSTQARAAAKAPRAGNSPPWERPTSQKATTLWQ